MGTLKDTSRDLKHPSTMLQHKVLLVTELVFSKLINHQSIKTAQSLPTAVLLLVNQKVIIPEGCPIKQKKVLLHTPYTVKS